jgi:hypothetical protein
VPRPATTAAEATSTIEQRLHNESGLPYLRHEAL